MNRRDFLKAAGAACVASFAPSAFAQQQKPNFLFIFADDYSFEAVRALGCDEIHTPNIDRLVNSGTTFTHTYNQGGWNGAICVASRTMLMTGAYLWKAHERSDSLGKDAEAGVFWPQLLEAQGYDTYMSGKWHVKIDPERVFKTVRNVRAGMPRDTKMGYNRPLEGVEDTWKPWDKSLGGFWKGGRHWTEVQADDGIDYLNMANESDNPFFIYLAFNAPHDPRQSPKEFVDMYPLDKVKTPENFLPMYPYAKEMAAGPGLRDEDLAPFPRTGFAVKTHRQEYYAIITHLDREIGRVLDQLEANGQADNTYVFFTADHGLSVGHHGLLGKQNMYDHSVRVPMVINGPGIEAGRRIHAPIYLQDAMATTLEWADADVPDAIDFKPLQPLLKNPDADHYEYIYGAYLDKQRMVTDGKYKLIHYPDADATLLFDLVADAIEFNDLADDEKYADLKGKLWAELKNLQPSTGDTVEL